MKTNVLNAGYVPAATGITLAGRVSNGIASLRDWANAKVNNFLMAIDCPLETERDWHYAKCLASCLLSIVFLPFLGVAVYQLFKAQSKKGGKR